MGQQQKDIKKTLKKYSAQFEVKDRLKMSKASKELVEKRRKLMQEYEDRRKLKQDEYILNVVSVLNYVTTLILTRLKDAEVNWKKKRLNFSSRRKLRSSMNSREDPSNDFLRL